MSTIIQVFAQLWILFFREIHCEGIVEVKMPDLPIMPLMFQRRVFGDTNVRLGNLYNLPKDQDLLRSPWETQFIDQNKVSTKVVTNICLNYLILPCIVSFTVKTWMSLDLNHLKTDLSCWIFLQSCKYHS